MRRILAIVWLTWKAALRFRLFWVLAALLAGTVVFLPLLLKDDGTAHGFIQILLAYNLTIITALLGFATLWLSCGSMARDLEECQIQMVAVKPISRWQIWLGKWLGIMFLNAVLLGLSGLSVYCLLLYRSGKLPQEEQEILRNEVFVARTGLREPVIDHSQDIERVVSQKFKENPGAGDLDKSLLRKQVAEEFKYRDQIVPPGYSRRWRVSLGLHKNTLHNVPLFIRTKFYSSETNSTATYKCRWRVAPDTPREAMREMSVAAETFTEFPIPPNSFDENGVLIVQVSNRNNVALLFPLDEGLEVLYREAGFGLNFTRGLAVILCWLSLLAALGLAAASFLSFPVAVFLCLTMLLVGFSSGSLQDILDQRSVLGLINTNTGVADKQTPIDLIMLPVMRGLLSIVRVAEAFSPIDSLSTGRSISWTDLGAAFGQVVLILGGCIAGTGMFILSRRELATAQGTS